MCRSVDTDRNRSLLLSDLTQAAANFTAMSSQRSSHSILSLIVSSSPFSEQQNSENQTLILVSFGVKFQLKCVKNIISKHNLHNYMTNIVFHFLQLQNIPSLSQHFFPCFNIDSYLLHARHRDIRSEWSRDWHFSRGFLPTISATNICAPLDVAPDDLRTFAGCARDAFALLAETSATGHSRPVSKCACDE